MNILKKILSCISAFVIAFNLCACNTEYRFVSNADIIEDSNVTAPGELPIVKRSITLKCAVAYSANIQDYAENDFTKWLEEQTGIHLEFEVMRDLRGTLKRRIETGIELPEVIIGSGFDEISRIKNGVNGSGIILDLGDYMDNYSYWLNDIYIKSTIPDVEKQLLSADGNRYFMPGLVEQTGNRYGMKTWINKTWLDRLEMDMPKTTEEFRDVMEAFVTLDPNGNGKADEIGMTGNKDGWCAQPYRFLINSFISECDPNICKYANVGDDNKLYINFTRNEYKDALIYISDLARKGLFDKECFTRTGEDMISMAQSEDNIIGCFTSGNPDWVFGDNRERMVEYEALPPLEGPSGIAYAYATPMRVTPRAYITKYCRHPLAAFRLLDFMMSKEATLRGRYGVEGRDWSYADENDRCIFESIGQRAIIRSNFQYGISNNATWENANPEFRYADIANGMAWNGDPLDSEKFKADALLAYYNKEPEEMITLYNSTEEEYERIAELEQNIIPYAEEQIKAFITGQSDVNTNWELFQSELKKRGIEEYLSLLQKGYDRYENGMW